MELGLSTRSFAGQRLSSYILDAIRNAGVQQIEIFAARQHLDYYDSNHVRDVAQWFSDHSITLHSLHAPLFAGQDSGRSVGAALSLSYTEKRRRIESMDEIKRAIEVAERLPFRYFVAHIGLPDDDYDLRKFDAAFTSLEHLRIFAKERGAVVALENAPGALNTPDRVEEFIQYTRLDLKTCFDVGHAHMAGGALPALAVMKSHIALVHLHDNHLEEDEHLPPFEGSIEWTGVMAGLRGIHGDPAALIELSGGETGIQNMPRIRETIRKLNEL